MRQTMSDKMLVEIAYAHPGEQLIIPLQVPMNICVREAIELSGILQKFKDIDLENNKVGIFGKITSLDKVLRDKDRVEIYRPLIADPKEIRRKKAKEAQKNKK